jgi:hypothetical protein
MHIFEVFYPDLFKRVSEVSVQFEYRDPDPHSEYGFGSGSMRIGIRISNLIWSHGGNLVSASIVCHFDVGTEIR